ncbi:MAG: DUF3180 domain-containing protein [Nocardioides sp.]
MSEEPQGSLRPTSPAALTAFAVVGLVCGWLVRRIFAAVDLVAPLVTWTQGLVLLVAAAALAGTAYVTTRQVAEPVRRPQSHQLVNRLVLARASALVGALLAGAYAGYAVSWLGSLAELAEQRALRSAVAAIAGVTVTAAALWLERACRVSSDDESA